MHARDIDAILARARDKRSISLDLKTERGREIFRELAKHADVIVENMSDGTVDRLGVGYEDIRSVNPRRARRTRMSSTP